MRGCECIVWVRNDGKNDSPDVETAVCKRTICLSNTSVLGRLYTFCISHFAGISQMFSQNTPRNMKHSLYTFRRISCEFCILLMPRKNKPQNPLTFCANTNPGTKCCEMRKAKKRMQNVKKSDTKYATVHFSFFAFGIIFVYFAISVWPPLHRNRWAIPQKCWIFCASHISQMWNMFRHFFFIQSCTAWSPAHYSTITNHYAFSPNYAGILQTL